MTDVQRVLMIVTAPQRRGAEVFARDLSRSMKGAGVDVRTAYLRHHDDQPLEMAAGDVVLTKGSRPSITNFPVIDPRIVRDLVRLITAFDPDIVQVNGGSTVKYGAAARWFSNGRWRLVYRNIGDPRVWMRGRLRPLVYRALVFSKVDGLVAVSAQTLAGHREIFGSGIAAVHIPRSVDKTLYSPTRSRSAVHAELGTSCEAPVTLFLGALGPEKRLDRLLRVHAQVRRTEPRAMLWIAGAGPEEAAVRTLIDELELSSSVRLLGTRSDAPDLLHAADLIALTSDTEGVPGVLLEAGACGRPVVATNVGGVASCVIDGVTGQLVDVDDEDGFAEAVGSLLGDRERREAMGTAAMAFVGSNFALDTARDAYLDFYRSVLQAT